MVMGLGGKCLVRMEINNLYRKVWDKVRRKPYAEVRREVSNLVWWEVGDVVGYAIGNIIWSGVERGIRREGLDET